MRMNRALAPALGTNPASSAIHFGRPEAVIEVCEALAPLAAALVAVDETCEADAEPLAAWARQVRERELAQYLLEGEVTETVAHAVLFAVADTLAYANVTAAWHGLQGVPAAVATGMGKDVPIAILDHAGRWCMPFVLRNDVQAPFWLLRGPSLTWLDVCGLDASERSGALLGFPHGAYLREASSSRKAAAVPPNASRPAGAARTLMQALVAGLLNGAVRRLVESSYEYARQRRSAGKPIIQHQAVALRLADLTLHQQGLSMYLTAAFEDANSAGDVSGPINASYVADAASLVAENAVQVAAGHGYVAGLPFRRLFEQVSTLGCWLRLIVASA